MRQKCPNCGEWCYAEERSFKEKAEQSANDTLRIGEYIGSKMGGVLGKRGENVGRRIGQFISGEPVIAGVGQLIGGLSKCDCHFYCEHCGYEWGANVDEDQSEELDAEEKELIANICEKVQGIKGEKDYKAIESLCKQLDRYDCAEANYWRAKAQQLIAYSYWDEHLVSDERWEKRNEWLNRAYDTIRQDIQFYKVLKFRK